MKRLGLYFSGTGNSKFCLQQFIGELNGEYTMCSIEQENAKELILEADEVILSYPIYYSNLPFILLDFIHQNKDVWKNKKVFIIATMGLFSGDGSGCSARLIKHYGGKILGGLHVKMPDCIIDVKILKKSKKKEQNLISSAISKTKKSAKLYQLGKPTQTGLGLPPRLLGLFGQRLWFKHMTSSYKDFPNIDKKTCINCNSCVKVCPMQNLSIGPDKEIIHAKACTLCYRCVHTCPTKSITILGKKVIHHSNS